MQNDKYKHAKERFLKRHGRRIETEQINAMEELIRQNRVISMAATQSPDRVQATLRIGTELITCIYVKSTGHIITFIDVRERKHKSKKHGLVKNGNRRPKNRRR